MSMLSRLAALGGGVTYSDITVVTSGTAVGNTTAIFGVSLQQNDVVFLTIGYNDVDWAVPSGYVQYTGGILTTTYGYACYYKVMGATPDIAINIGDGNDSSAFTYYVLRGVQTESPVIEVTNIIGSTTAALNPPSVTVFPKCMVLTAAFTGNGVSAIITAGPTGYSGFLGVDAQGSSDTYTGTAYKIITSGTTEDPGAFSMSSTAIGYGSTSIVIRPYSASFSSVAPVFVASAATQQTAAAAALTINKPAGTIDGDFMVAIVCAAGGADTWTGDTGWTEVADQGASPTLRLAYKAAGASEPSSYTFTSTGSGQLKSGVILTYRYADYDTAAGSFTTAANPLVLSSISPSLSQSRLIACGARASANVTLGTPTSMTARATDSDGSSPSYIVCDQLVPKGPTGTRSVSTGSTSAVAGIMLAIKPTRSLT